MTVAEQLRIAQAAGVSPFEMRVDQEHGLLIAPSGVRKLIAVAPDRFAAAALGQRLTRILRNRMHEVRP